MPKERKQYTKSSINEVRSEHFTIAVTPGEKVVLDKLCQHWRKNRSELIRQFIELESARLGIRAGQPAQ